MRREKLFRFLATFVVTLINASNISYAQSVCVVATYENGSPLKACRDETGRYKMYDINDKSIVVPKEQTDSLKRKDKARMAYDNCVWTMVGKNVEDRIGFQNCMSTGIAYCNVMGNRTSQDFKVSPYSGRVTVDNGICSADLEATYEGDKQAFMMEYSTFLAEESEGYHPVGFDIRKYLVH